MLVLMLFIIIFTACFVAICYTVYTIKVSLGGHDSPPLPTESATHHNSPPPGPSLLTGGIRKRYKLPKASVARGPSPSTSRKSHSLELQGVAPTVDTASHRSTGVWNNCSAQLPDSIDAAVAVAAFQSQRDVLLTAIHHCLTEIANKLLAKFVISPGMLDKACNPRNGSRERAVYLLSCMQDRIKTDPADFVKVVDILESEPTLIRQARQLVDRYCNPPPTSSAVTIDPIQRFSADLKVKYKCCPVASDKWPPTPSKKYVELAVVQGDSAGREEYIRHVSKGSIDEGHKTKYITEEQILDLCVELVGKGRVVVIEGAPGIGKSTLAWELCRKWEEYASMEAYSLVILLRLRDKRVQHLNDVSSLFYAYDRADRTSLVEEIKNNQGKGVLFVLDGFDELPKSLQYEGVLTDLLRKSVLPQSTVLVTNRRSAMVSLLNICRPVIEKRIEILGFSPKSIEEYAASVFSGDDLEGFKSYISRFENPAISSLMYVPLYAVFVAMIYHDASKGALPCTLTQLYTKLCLTILNRNLETRTCYTSVRMFQKLPDTPYKQFLELSKLAYEGFEREEVIFYGDIGEHFDFLDAVPDLYGGYNVSFNFLHLTLQEFFAAYHISQMSDSGVELFRYTGNDMRWNVVWRFVAGLTEFKFLDSSSVGISKHYNTLTVFFTQCLFEAQHMKIDFAYTFGCATMSHSAHDCTHFDYYALGYCIANCTTAGSSWKVDLGIASPDQVHAFTQGLMTNKSCTGVIELLQTTTNDVKCLHECILAAATSPLRSITDLRIYGATLTSNAERIHLFELISHMPRVQKLCIAYCDLRTASPHCGPMDNDGLLKLLLYLPHSNVTSLDLRETGLEHYLEQSPSAKDYCTAIQAMISPPSKLKKLRIRPHFTSCHEGNLAMMRLVSSPSTLRKLSVFVSFDCSLLKAFETDNHLTELKIRHVSGVFGENWPALVPDTVRIIQNSETLETLKLSGLDFRRDDILRDITAAVQRNNTLRHVRITVDVNQGDNTQLEKTLRDIDPRVTLTKP